MNNEQMPSNHMNRIRVDFNTLTSEPVGLVKLGEVGTPNGNRLPPLRDGERVVLWEEGLEVEATIIFDAAEQYWFAIPDPATWHDLPLSPEFEAELSSLT